MNSVKITEAIEIMDYSPKQMEYLYTDNRGRRIYSYQCRQPGCDRVYSAWEKSKRKSCGCLNVEQARKQGKANRKTNRFCLIARFRVGVCFYNNCDGYFIFDLEDFNFIREHSCTALINKKKNRIDPVCTVDGKQVLLARWLMQTPKGLEVDHINHDTNDLRKCNLRNCTKEQNNYNKKNAKQGFVKQRDDGKYIIVDFPKEDTSFLLFDSEEEAFETLFELQDKYYGEFGSRRSQEISDDNIENYISFDTAKQLQQYHRNFFERKTN